MRRRFVVGGLIALCLASVSGAQEIPTLTASRTGTPPVVDGDLSDGCWKEAARAGNFYLYDRLEPAGAQTEAFVCYDDAALYIAFRCQEPAMDRLVAKKRLDDQSASSDDCVEVFLSAGTNGATYFHFIVTPVNARLDQWNRVSPRVMDNAWDGDWKSAAKRNADSWNVEMAISWYSLSSDLGTGPWKMNLCRGKRTEPVEFSSWAFVKGNFHDPGRFGKMDTPNVDFASLKGIEVSDISVPGYYVTGKNHGYTARCSVRNTGSSARKVTIEAADRPYEGTGGAPATRTVQLPPFGKETLEFSLGMPVLGERRITVRALDADSGKPLTAASRAWDVFPQLMKGYLDRNYYTTEKAVRCIATLNIPRSEARFTAVFQVRPDKATPVVARSDVKESRRTEIIVPMERIPLGTHPAELSIVDADGNTVAREVMQVRREPSAKPPVREVKTDRDAMIALVDGKPFFPIGIYGVADRYMKEVREAGFNCTIFWGAGGGQAPNIEKKPPEEQRAVLRRYLDASQEAGLMVIEWPMNYAQDVLSYADPKLQEKMDHFLKTRLPLVIDTQKDHPALLAYYSLDEPSGDYLRSCVAEASRVITERDPYHPNYVLFCVGIEEWPEAMDIAGLDWYPRFGQDRVILSLTGARSAVRTARRMRVPTWHVPLCEASSGSVRMIRAEEQRAQTYLTLIGGVNGIIWWVWPPRHGENWAEMKKLAGELNGMMPALVTAIPDQTVLHEPRDMEDTVQAAVRVAEGKVYLITCNASEFPADASFSLPAGLRGSAEVLFENRKVNIRDGVIRDRFNRYGTHVYVMNGSWPDSGTVKVSVALDRKETAKPVGQEEPVSEQPENLIVDSGFEGEGFWYFSGADGTRGVMSGEARHGGKKAAVIERSTERGGSRWEGWEVRLKPRTRYLFGCHGRAEMVGGAEAGIFLSGPYPGGDYIRASTTVKFRDRSPSWDRYIASFATREEAVSVRPCLFFQNGQGTAWFDDMFLVATSDAAEEKNLLRNTGFEQESAVPFVPEFWNAGWASVPGFIGGPGSAWGLDETTAFEGKRSLRITQSEWTPRTYPGYALSVGQGRLRWEAGQPYTFSVYLKADKPKTHAWLWFGYTKLQDVWVDTEWKRYTVTATSPSATDQGFVTVSMQSAGTIWVDAAQMERGSEISDYAAAP